MSEPTFAFDLDTAVRPVSGTAGPGLWVGQLTDRWDIVDKPNGGYVLATAVRAMSGAVANHPDPFTVTAHYLRPSEAGPVDIDVEVVRTGRKLSTITASFSQGGKARIQVLGTFGDLNERIEAGGATHLRSGAPIDVEPPTTAIHRGATTPLGEEMRIALQTDLRMHPDTGWIVGKPSGTAEVRGWIRFADGREPDVSALPFFADALPPALFELDSLGWVPTIELTVHVRAKPAPGWLRCVMSTRFLADGYFEEDGEIWDSRGVLVAQSRQLGMVFRP